jgi:hypothetical protein
MSRSFCIGLIPIYVYSWYIIGGSLLALSFNFNTRDKVPIIAHSGELFQDLYLNQEIFAIKTAHSEDKFLQLTRGYLRFSSFSSLSLILTIFWQEYSPNS